MKYIWWGGNATLENKSGEDAKPGIGTPKMEKET